MNTQNPQCAEAQADGCEVRDRIETIEADISEGAMSAKLTADKLESSER
jgi:hypothetical protein